VPASQMSSAPRSVRHVRAKPSAHLTQERADRSRFSRASMAQQVRFRIGSIDGKSYALMSFGTISPL